MQQTPRTFSHIGLSVPDLDAAVKFYSEVLGFYVVMAPSEAVEDDSAIGVMCTDVFGPGWGWGVWMAALMPLMIAVALAS